MSGFLDSPLYKQMLANTLSGQNSQPQYPGQALANTGSQILQALTLYKSLKDDASKQASTSQAIASALQPNFQDAQITPQVSGPGLPASPGATPMDDPARQAANMANAQNGGDPSAKQVMARLLASGNPDIQEQVLPKMLDQALKQPEGPIKLGPGDSLIDPTTHQPLYQSPMKPDRPEATPDIMQIAQALFPGDAKAQHDYMVKNSPANLRAITNIDAPKQSWQILTDPKAEGGPTQYRYDMNSGTALTLDGKPYAPGGASKIASGQARSAAALAAQRYVEEHPSATAEDVARFAADYGKTVKSTAAFSTGKQGDLVRSFNVAISHLNTLGGLVDALGNNDIQALNKLGNAYKQQTGSSAPTNFDAAKAIVGDEIIKAIVGGGGALADRENAQNQINRANSPEQLRGVIKTYKDLMGGQLKGLKKQYADTTGLGDFDERLSPETRAELEGQGGVQAAPASGWSNFRAH